MTKHRFFNWCMSLAICAALSTSYLLDGPSDTEAVWDQDEAINELRTAAVGSARREAAAARLCNEQRGPNSEARWTAEGHLVCTVRRGVVVAKGGDL